MMTVAQQNRRTGARMQAWLDDRPHKRRALLITLKVAEIAGRRKIDGKPLAEVAHLLRPLVVRKVVAAPSTRTLACIHGVGCEGAGWLWDRLRVVPVPVYCHCGAGERLRVAEFSRHDAEARPLCYLLAGYARPEPLTRVIQQRAPREHDGRTWECQCARCGAEIDWMECERCAGDGHIETGAMCWECNGTGGWRYCTRDGAECHAHPLDGREQVQRGAIEWYVLGGGA